MTSDKERRWVERMQAAGLFPKPPPEPPAPPEGAYSFTFYGDGTAFVQINKVALPFDAAMEICKLAMDEAKRKS